MNVVILSGRLSSRPRCTELTDGTVRWNLDVSCPDAAGRLVGVPVAWDGAVPDTWDAHTPIVVTGTVRRRFFRTAAGTQSRTEVAAAAVVEVTRRRSEDTALARSIRLLGPDAVTGLRSMLAAPPPA